MQTIFKNIFAKENNKKIHHFSYLFIFAFCIIFYWSFSFSEGGFLADDNSMRFPTHLKNLFEPNVYSRPFSAFIKAALSQFYFSRQLMFGIYSLMILLHFYIFFILMKKLLQDKYLSAIISFLSFVFIFSNSTMFSPTMIVSLFPVLLLFGCCLLVLKEKNLYYFLAGNLLFASTLFYEIIFFLFPLVALLNIKTNNRKDILSRILYLVIMPTVLMFGYKNYIAALIFNNYAPYTQNKTSFESINILFTIISILKTYLIDVFVLIRRAISATVFFNFTDFILLLLGACCAITIYYYFRKIKFVLSPKVFLYSLAIFIFSHFIFLVSIYKVNAFGYENRTLGVIRFSYSIILVFSLLYVQKYLKNTFFEKLPALFLSLNIFVFSWVLIAEKNAWIFASDLNEKIILKMDKILPEKMETNHVFIAYDKSKYPELIADEPTIKSPFEVRPLVKIFAPKRNIIGNLFIPKSYHIGQIFGKKINNREKTKLNFDKNNRLIHQKISLPFYFFDYDNESFKLIRNKKEWFAFEKTQSRQ